MKAMKKRRLVVSIVAAALALLMVIPILISVINAMQASAVTQSEIDALQEEADALEQQQQELESQIGSLEYEQAEAMAQKTILDEQIDLTQAEIDNIDAQIAVYDQLIVEKTEELEATIQEREETTEQMKTRIRAMEENGTVSYLAVILEAESFSDLLTRIDFIDEIISSDQAVIDQLEAAEAAVEAARTDLESAQTEQEEMRVQQEQAMAELERQVEEASALIAQIESNIEELEAAYAAYDAEVAAIDAEIAEKQEELDRIMEEQQSGGIVATGTFIWPSPSSTYITSLFGTRYHPILHYYRSHNGVDIGASYGTDVLAADSGTVLTSTYSSSYGNYVVISHGNGTTTLYAHMSQRFVSAGDVVTQGQVIGAVGSTGMSTGPHLHFEVTVNGTRVDPLNYFSNYTVSPSA